MRSEKSRDSADAPFHDEVRDSRSLIAVLVVAVVLLAASLIPSPYAVERPGPVVDTLGTVEDDGEDVPVVSVSGIPTYETEGTLNLLTVSIAGSPEYRLSWLRLVPAFFDRSQRIAPLEEFFPSGITLDERDELTTAQMDSSQLQSAAAAFRELGLDVGAEFSVAGVEPESPADGVLRTGDRILSANGHEIVEFSDLRAQITAAEGPLLLEIERDGATSTVSLTPAGTGEEARIGAVISTHYDLPAEVEFRLSDIGGPSAGLVFALAVIDESTPGSLLGEHTVSVTGTMSGSGEVGAIGGLPQKAWAAERAGSDLLIMPLENCGDAENMPGDLEIAPVATLEEALEAIERLHDGEPQTGLERCDAALRTDR